MTQIVKIYKTLELSSSHQLNLPYESKCNRVHGHNFKIEIWVNGEVNENGMVIDFYLIKKEVMKLDHQNLNDFISIPTAENISKYLIEKIKRLGEKLYSVKVRVWETSTAFAEVEESMPLHENK